MTRPTLTALKEPIAIRPEFVISHPRALRVKMKGMSWSKGDFTVFCESGLSSAAPQYTASSSSSIVDSCKAGAQHMDFTKEILDTKLLVVEAKALSCSQKRTVRDASGLPLFDVYQSASWKVSQASLQSTPWLVQLPGAKGNKPLAWLSWSNFNEASRRVLNMAVFPTGKRAVHLQVREEGVWKLRINVYLDDRVVMTAKMTDKFASYIPGKGLEWIVEPAEGMDTSLVTAIMVVLGATLYSS
ncbi:unnamed protein product [Discula destructiva]